MIKNIITDLGNVVLEFNPLNLVQKYGVNPERIEEVASAIFMGEDWYYWDRDLITKAELENNAVALLNPEDRKLVNNILNSWWEYMEFNEPLLDFYKEQKGEGKKIYILSNYSPDFYELKWDQKYYDLFDGQVISCDYKVGKPDPKIYEILIDKYNLKPCESLFIDDLNINLEASRKFGLSTIRYHLKEMDLEDLIYEYQKHI